MRKLFILAILCSLTLSCSQKKSNNPDNPDVQSEDITEASAEVEKETQIDKQIFDLEIGKSTIDDVKANFSGNSVTNETHVDSSMSIISFGGEISFQGQDWDEALCVVKNGALYALTLTKKTQSSESVFNAISSELKNKYDAHAVQNKKATAVQTKTETDDQGIVVTTNSNSLIYWDKETLVSVVKEERKVTYRITARN